MMFEPWLEPGLRLIAAWQTLPGWLVPPMQGITFLGALEFYLLLLPFIYWTLSPALAARTFAVLLANDFISTTCKILWHGPRPYWIPGETGVRGWAAESSYGVPSGHAGGSLSTWGYLATQVRSPVFRALAAVLILLVGFSRPYLGVHFPHDVLLGWLIAATVVLVALMVQERLGAWLMSVRNGHHLAVSALIASAIMAWGWAVPGFVADSPDPAAWAGFAERARSPSHFFALAGTLFGLMVGYRRQRELVSYAPAALWRVRLAQYAGGILVMFAIYLGLGALSHALAATDSLPGCLLRFVRFAAVAWWVTELAPRCFMRWQAGAGTSATGV